MFAPNDDGFEPVGRLSDQLWEDKRTITAVTQDMAKQERAMLGLAQHNSIVFEAGSLPNLSSVTVGLEFRCPNVMLNEPQPLRNKIFGLILDSAVLKMSTDINDRFDKSLFIHDDISIRRSGDGDG